MVTNADSGAGRTPVQRRWGWEHPAAPRWLLLGRVGVDDSDSDDIPLALCAEIEGLFVDLPPRPRERFTLVGCAPDGALAELLDRLPVEALGTERAWLGDISLAAPPGSLSWFDVHVYDRTEAVVRPDVAEFALLGRDDTPYGTCRDVSGVFRERAAPPVPQVRLLGCRPETPLLTALGAVGNASKASRRRRRIRAEVHMTAADGAIRPVIDGLVSGTVVAGEPSRLGAGLLDVTVDSDPREPLPLGVLDILEQWRTRRPAARNEWAGHHRKLRHHWAGVTLAHRVDAAEQPPGTTYDLDGRYVTDIEGFYCAIGEAINGPGGYFGWNLHALHDCLRGDFGARTPFRLVWHDSAVARAHLVAGYDGRRLAPATTLDDLLDILAAHQVEVDLR
ncbi:barstar family protein [Micromonospora maris]|uniref:barstar family protein n=1 Tax=Micromonospora maris TaxID=1003110 RepID=UPI002E1481FD|nr:barstar family protein [Micromonospora maris]